jgi:penicillin-binding protein 2
MTHKQKNNLKRASSWQELLIRGSQLQTASLNGKNLSILKGVLIIICILFFARLVQVQLVEGSVYRNRAENNRIVTRRQAATRGAISDRDGNQLVRNVPSYKRLVPGTNLVQDQFETITKQQALSLDGKEDEWIFLDIDREYIFGKTLSPLLGYVNEVSQEELDDLGPDYVVGDLIGKSGIEKYFEDKLRGNPGNELLETNSSGETQRTIGSNEPTTGQDITLSIDLKLQQTLYDAFEGRTGAAVALKPETGEILSLVRVPSFDPNDISKSLVEENQPFFNRAVAGAYPPGSIFKPIVMTAGLEEGIIDRDYTVEDTGEIRIDQYRYGNWYYDQYGRTEGQVDLVKALQRSNDIFFYKLGELVGPNNIAKWAQLFGLGTTTNLNFPGEVPGLVPNPEWKRRFTGSNWFLGNTYHYAIGQGDLQVTPIQMALVTAVFANGGRLCDPTIEKISQGSQVSCKELGISIETLDTIKEGMIAACQPGGTAFPFFDFIADQNLPTDRQVACKTGTAQFGDPQDRTHAWFMIFAPVENPEIVLTILLEKGGEGSYDAAPIAKTALQNWFNR